MRAVGAGGRGGSKEWEQRGFTNHLNKAREGLCKDQLRTVNHRLRRAFNTILCPSDPRREKLGRWESTNYLERSMGAFWCFPLCCFSIPTSNYPLLFTHSLALGVHGNGSKFWINHFTGVLFWASCFLWSISGSYSEKEELSQLASEGCAMMK